MIGNILATGMVVMVSLAPVVAVIWMMYDNLKKKAKKHD